MRIRRWLRQIEPRILAELDRPSLAWAKPWLDRHELFAFTRRPLARGLAIGKGRAVLHRAAVGPKSGSGPSLALPRR